MLGYPGAGKTTTAGIIHDLTKAVHLSSDQIRFELFPVPTFSPTEHEALYRTLDEQTEKLLRMGKDVIYDANLNRLAHRQDKYAICQHTSSTPVLVWVQTPKDVARQRATKPGRIHLVPHGETLEQMFERIADVIESPGSDEPYTAVDGTKITPEYVSRQLGL